MCPICTKQHTPEKTITNKQWVCHTLALPFTLKNILRQKKKNYENSNISTCKNIIFKKSSKRNQDPSSYHNSITDCKFQHKPIFQKSSYESSRHIIYRGQNPLSYYILCNESKHNFLAYKGKANKTITTNIL